MGMTRNSRFNAGTKCSLHFNPIASLTGGIFYNALTGDHDNSEELMTYGLFSGYSQAIHYNDIFASPFVGGRVSEGSESQLIVGLTIDAFAGEEASYIKNNLKGDAFIFGQPTSGAWYCRYYTDPLTGDYSTDYNEDDYNLDGGETGYLDYRNFDGYDSGDNNMIGDVFIIEREIVQENARYGYSERFFNNSFSDRIRLGIKATVPQWKMEQLMSSTAIAIRGSGYIKPYIEYSNIDNYNYYYQDRGGSLSPVVRLLTLDKGSITFSPRRNRYEIEGVMS